MRNWLSNNLRAIDENPAVRHYAVILSVLHALTGLSWFTYKNVADFASLDHGFCSPFVPQCTAIRAHLSPEAVSDLVVLYMLLGLAAAFTFLLRARRTALAIFLFTTLLGIGIYSLDYRLRSNETYMLSWAILVLLVAPRKAQTLQALVALFYVWAGTLKVNADWMSGTALYTRPYLIPEALIPASCVYVLVLELVMVWGLFSPWPRLRWAVYAQLMVFHVLSWKVVGYHYPLLMFGIIAIYPLVWRLAPAETLTFSSLRADRNVRASVIGAVVGFSAFQIVPHLFPGDSAITGEGRFFAVHMFDGRVVCAGGATVRDTAGRTSTVAIIDPMQTTRLRCDPIDLLSQARRLCRMTDKRSDVVSVDVAIDAKRATEDRMRPLMHIDDFCKKSIEYSLWHHNAWISVD
jgi:hypothetical protein